MTKYWLDPNGELIEVISHAEYASEYLIENEIEWDYHICYAYQVLHSLGWVRVSIYNGKIRILGDCTSHNMTNTMDPKMNQVQMSVAKQLCYEHGVTLKSALNYE